MSTTIMTCPLCGKTGGMHLKGEPCDACAHGSSAAPCCASLGDKSACRVKSAKNARQTYYTFRNLDGQTIQLRGDLTMEDMVRMGWTDIRLVKPDAPLPPHVWRADSLPNANVDLPDTAAQDSASKSNSPAVSG